MGLRGHFQNLTRTRRLACAGAGALALGAALGAPAALGATTTQTLSAAQAQARTCTAAPRPGAEGVATTEIASPGVAAVTARLTDAAGDWDLAVFDARSGAVVAGSSYAGGDEIAQGFATGPGELIVQACRVSGPDATATVSVETFELTEPAPRMQLVRVETPTETTEEELTALGLDLTEHGGEGYVDVVLHGPADGALLADHGLDYTVVDPDLAARSVTDRAAEERALARGTAAGGLPSGRTGTYRRLFEYSQEMRRLAKRNRRLVRYFTLPFETYEGRKVEAIEVAPRVRRKDGRPVFLMMGVHHAREWPSAEHTLEFAYQLIRGWKDGSERIRRLMRRARVVFVPIVNPDGFNLSREAGVGVADGGRDTTSGTEYENLLIPYEYHRKNCRFPDNSEDGSCDPGSMSPNNGIVHPGVDPNRNYGGFWGGPGASAPGGEPPGELAADYRGTGPFSEPETRNIKALASKRQVTALITNHTFSNLILRPPGTQAVGRTPDERIMRRLGAAMAGENGYANQFGYQLYDTSGTTEDWSYWSTGGLGYTFEIGPEAFHPQFSSMVAEYRGTTDAAGEGGGNRAAYLKALAAAAKPRLHGVISGQAPSGAFLKLAKRFTTRTSKVLNASGEEGKRRSFRERLTSTIRVPGSGRFTWHVNPSTRPLVDPRRDIPQPRPGSPSEPIAFQGLPTDSTPCADYDTQDPGCWNDHPFRVPGGPGIDNGTATVRIEWATPATDWDMKIFRDTDRDGSSDGETRIVGSSADGPTTSEETTVTRPDLARGKYVIRVINFAGLEPYDGSVTFGKTPKPEVNLRRERWTLTCRASKNGPVLDRRRVFIKRGGEVDLDLRRACG